MPRYKLHTVHFLTHRDHEGKTIARRVRAGEEVEYNGIPGEYMEPLDDAAWDAHHAYAAKRYKRFPFKTRAAKTQAASAPPVDYSAVTIPDDWRDLPGLAICHLAVRLGAPRLIKRKQAFAFVEAEALKRGMVPPEEPEEEAEDEGVADEQEMTDGQ